MGKSQSKHQHQAGHHEVPSPPEPAASNPPEPPKRYLKGRDLTQPESVREGLEGLLADLSQHESACLLAIGPVGVGKSSYLNTAASFSNDRLEFRAVCGQRGGASVTRTFRAHVLTCHDEPVSWTWTDTPGDLISQLQEAEDKEAMIEATVDQIVELALAQPQSCVMAMVSAETFIGDFVPHERRVLEGSGTQNYFRLLNALFDKLAEKDARMVVVLTKCDLVDVAIEDNTADLQHSERVHEMRKCIAREVGLNLNTVYPIVNLVDELEPSENAPLGYLALVGVRCALIAARHARVVAPTDAPMPAHEDVPMAAPDDVPKGAPGEVPVQALLGQAANAFMSGAQESDGGARSWEEMSNPSSDAFDVDILN